AVAAPSPIERVAQHLRQRAEPGHLVVLSSAWPTYVYPLLLALRSAGVHGVEVVVAPPELLRAQGPALADRAHARSLSLVNLLVSYDRASVWDPELVRDVAERARAAGFRVVRMRGGGEAGDEAPRAEGERWMWIVGRAQVRYFPG